MERRIAIKQVLIFAGGMALLPSFLKAAGKASVQLNNLDVGIEQEKLLSQIAEIIIPKTTTPGATELGLHLFVLKMVDDCYDANARQKFMSGLKSFEGLDDAALKQMVSDTNYGKSSISEDAKAFYRIMKQQIINGYMNSKYVMTNLVKWELVPARYNGYFPVKA
ncbi:gluconate 2-dehydrogenase subunit 3 family protein [Pedobacter psychroterrae]|uniref:Gluconate 2-dehydrogenase subunit 3 family protein n=1 Tax=Pedobacter psychroterrae TaxID=2530453 RepID=A0A4V2MKA8_9SPHI|nr:gluconate 2-dehydrogenase subunit 3 family protein [Pedobacter psychroterrae]TCC97446.1 gluconate 2-dehydrogenase subunit 3 family protein [Pedobacter psychroterrae]